MVDGKTAALCALAFAGGLDVAAAFQGSGAASLPTPIEAAASSQMPSRLRRGSNPQAISQHRSMVMMTTDALQAAAPNRSAGVLPSLPRVPSPPPAAAVVTTDAGGFSSIPIGAPRAGHGKGASRLNGDPAPNISKPVTPPQMQADSMGFCWIPVGGRSKHK